MRSPDISALAIRFCPMNRTILSIALFLCVALPAEASVPGPVNEAARSLVTVSVVSASGTTLRSGPGIILDREGIVLCSCTLIAKWAENLDHALVVTLHDGPEMRIANLLSRPCSQGASYFRINAEGLPAVSLSREGSQSPRESYYIVSQPSHPSHVRASPLPASPPDSFARKAAAGSGLHLLLNRKGEVLGVALTEPSKAGRQTYTFRADELSSRLGHLRKMARRLAAAARLPAPDAPPPAVVPGKTLAPEMLAGIEKLKQQALLTPGDAEIHIALGKAYESANMNTEAIHAFTEAAAHDPRSVSAHIHLGLACYRASRYHEAIKALTAAADLDASLVEVHAKLGTVYIITGDYQLAIDSLKKALSASPGEPSLHFNLGLAYYLKGDKNDALGEYAILKRLDGEWAERLADLMY